jgi:chromosome segregation protein
VLAKNLETGQSRLNHLNKEQSQAEGLISEEEGNIASQSSLREAVLVAITQTKAELEALARRTVSDEATLKILQDTCRHNEENLKNLENQMAANAQKKLSLEAQIKDCQAQIQSASQQIEIKQAQLKENEEEYRRISAGAGDEIKKIEQDRQKLDGLKDKLYELQMQNKDLDYQYATVKERILQAYKVDLEAMTITPQEIGKTGLCREIETLKQKLDSLGTVNLVAIEEYDELKKRYDFLNQQQNDLLNAKEQLHQAILKINRTTKQMFLETFEKVKAEFRNYFRLLFNGGDAQVFLIDEQDPLESGIEIICRPPGKKLQNVLLLSGGEKSLSAIALIFAIFKVKPSPFCVLDEIDAALDEANVERFAKVLQEFTKQSQFIVITHNKRTIANADIMYGITMQESGVSKIVSVKFAKEAIKKDKEPDLATEPA